MTTRFRLAGSAIVLTLCVASPARQVSAESDAVEGTYGDVVCKSAIGQELFPNPPVLGAPFSAEVTTVWHPPANPEMRATAYYYRDGAGRVRVEQTLVGRDAGPQRVIVMPDPSSMRAYVLDPLARTNTRIWRGTANMMTGAGACQTYVLSVSITRVIDFVIDGPQILDPTLKLVVSSHGENPQIGSIDYEMTKISVAEPPAHLFELPDDYAAMPDNAITPPCWGGWGGPYSELMRPCENQDRWRSFRTILAAREEHS